LPEIRIPITRPVLGQAEVDAAGEAILSGWLTQGRRVADFEASVARFVGAPEAVATTSCTTALHLALLVAGVGPGDEVICPSFTFIATANAIAYTGAKPVFCDIDRRTYNLDPELLEEAITPRTRAIVPVDQIGLPAELPLINEVARRHSLRVVEDAAPSLGSAIGERRVGSISELTCFSFHPRKSITTGEGGMITTADPALAERLRRLRAHAASSSALSRHQSGSTELEEYPEVGFNYRMTDIQGAIGLAQMRRLDGILAERRRLARRYHERLAAVDGVEVPGEPEGYTHTYQSYCVRVRRGARDHAMADLAAEGIATRRGVMAIHLEPAYREAGMRLPETEAATRETLLLPLFVGMTEAEQDEVVDALRRSLAAVTVG
jgi:perosamine synthetase